MSEAGQSRLRIAIVGCGRVGAVLGAAWHRAGHRISAVTARTDTSRLRAEALLPGVPVVDESMVGDEADLVLVAVPDRVLAEVVDRLASSGVIRAGQFVVHPAGRYGLDVLEPATRVGAAPLALHPALPLTGTSMDLERLSGSVFGVTAPENLRTVAEALVVELGAEPVWIPDQARNGYHAALALAANYTMTLVNESIDLLADAGAEDPARILGPLVRASVDTALERRDAGQTGPIMRGDGSTVASHMAWLQSRSPLAFQAYRSLGNLTVDRLLAAGVIDTTQASDVLRALEVTMEPPQRGDA
ncbi:MAG: Rossmann-like and DUF2520 domain-containing protein [Candidatus Nanopelagicales bacterium]